MKTPNGQVEGAECESGEVAGRGALFERLRGWFRPSDEAAADKPGGNERNGKGGEPFWFAGRKAAIEARESVTRLHEAVADLGVCLRSESERSERTGATVRELAGVVHEMPARLRGHKESLDHIAARLEAAERQIERLAGELPKMGQKGSTSMQEIKTRLEEMRRADGELATQMKQLREADAALTTQLQKVQEEDAALRESVASLTQAVAQLTQQASQHDETLVRLDTHAGARERQLADTIEAQNKRFGSVIWMMVAALSVVLVTAMIQLGALLRQQ